VLAGKVRGEALDTLLFTDLHNLYTDSNLYKLSRDNEVPTVAAVQISSLTNGNDSRRRPGITSTHHHQWAGNGETTPPYQDNL